MSDRLPVGHDFVGLWVTADGVIRQRLLPGGRYTEARGSREAAYTGDYRIEGTMIYYHDDTGFSADGEFRKDVLYHAGMVMFRDAASPAPRP
ncbi:putative ligand-binding protein with streptavidin-like fold [Glaciihabitans tibetensis]|uniref:Putative ligand-binding protein with streptavidin-like fold n=1 Tax=Glaciihabitans tibetensis TaxID=1266600 RepID=A0A2T0V730_9MICO|nr:Atu4866 domain-containing protein [Glaciihabitans tibetensis]PRY65917.1 putative ligand-binding protein with streptavidin-like fold [Glaciihabitans tibetensis]